MISSFTPAGTKIVALRSGYGVQAKGTYTVRGFVLNRHWRTQEPDPHVLLVELLHPVGFPHGARGEIGFPRDAFVIPNWWAVGAKESRVEVRTNSTNSMISGEANRRGKLRTI